MAALALSCSSLNPHSANPDPPSQAELVQLLGAELIRLGKDPDRTAAVAPANSGNQVFDLTLEAIDPDGAEGNPPTSVGVRWTERLIGDYDGNGEVNISDLTPLGLHLQKSVEYDDPVGHGGFQSWPSGDPSGSDNDRLNWVRARVDGDGNAEINLADITPLAHHWQEQLGGYLIERGVNDGAGSIQWEAQPLDIGHGVMPSVPRSLISGGGSIAAAVYEAEIELDDPQEIGYFRVRPWHAEGSGPASNVAIYIPADGADITPPAWTDAVGVQTLMPQAETSMQVSFGTAVDEQSPPVSYRVYWAAGDPQQPNAPFDYVTASSAETAASPYLAEGLTAGQYYRFAVRAADNAESPNEERNAVVLGRLAGPQDVYPPQWTQQEGLLDVLLGSEAAIAVFNAAADETTDEFGTWSSGPVSYTVYYGLGRTPNLDEAQQVKVVDPEGHPSYAVELPDVDSSQPSWYLVRATDGADPPNTDANENFVLLPGFSAEYSELPSEPGDPDFIVDDVRFVTNVGKQDIGVLVLGHYDDPEIRTAKYFSLDGIDYSLVSKHSLGRVGYSGNYDAVLNAEGELHLAYALRTETFLHGSLGYVSPAGQTAFEFTPANVDKVILDRQGNPAVKTIEYTEFSPPVFREYISKYPFTTQHLINESTEDFDSGYFFAESEAALIDGSVVFCLRRSKATVEPVLLFAMLSDTALELQPKELEDLDGLGLASIHGLGVEAPIIRYTGYNGTANYSKLTHKNEEISYIYSLPLGGTSIRTDGLEYEQQINNVMGQIILDLDADSFWTSDSLSNEHNVYVMDIIMNAESELLMWVEENGPIRAARDYINLAHGTFLTLTASNLCRVIVLP